MWSVSRDLLILCILAMALIGDSKGYSVYVPVDDGASDNGGGSSDGGGSGGSSAGGGSEGSSGGGAGGSSAGGGSGGSSGGGGAGGSSGGGGAGGTGGSSHGGGDSGKTGHKVNRVGTSCVYDLDDTVELCHLESATQKVRFELIRGPFDCERYVIETTDCLGCKYVHQPFGKCKDGHHSKHEELIPDSKPGCPEKRTITRRCTEESQDEQASSS